jgi:hypothetical protein
VAAVVIKSTTDGILSSAHIGPLLMDVISPLFSSKMRWAQKENRPGKR